MLQHVVESIDKTESGGWNYSWPSLCSTGVFLPKMMANALLKVWEFKEDNGTGAKRSFTYFQITVLLGQER